MKSGSAAGGVVLLHGIARTPRSLNRMQRALDAEGFATLNLAYASRQKPLQELAEDIHPAVVHFAEGLGGPVHFVTHSMGGLLARIYVARHRPARLGRMVMLGPPNGGSEVADLLQGLAFYRAFFGPAGQQLTTAHAMLAPVDYPVGVIAGSRSINLISSTFLLRRPNDGKVTVESTRLEGMTDHVVVRAAHPWLARNPVAIDQTIAFLRNGRFRDPA